MFSVFSHSCTHYSPLLPFLRSLSSLVLVRRRPVRLEETIDMSSTVKFVYVHWIGKDVPFVKRGKYGVVQGSIEKHFSVSMKCRVAYCSLVPRPSQLFNVA